MSSPRSFFYNHKFTIGCATARLAVEAFSHAWPFYMDNYSTGFKIMQGVVVPLLNTAIWGVVGHIADKVTAINDHMVNESTPLNANRF